MNCPYCQRANDPRRHYCGRCGGNLAPVCRRCTFVNDQDDRFCGGCGDAMRAPGAEGGVSRPELPPVTQPAPLPVPRPELRPDVTRPAPTLVSLPPSMIAAESVVAPPPVPVVSTPAPQAPASVTVTPRRNDLITADDLAELLATSVPASAPALPSESVSQDDLDKLFGGGL